MADDLLKYSVFRAAPKILDTLTGDSKTAQLEQQNQDYKSQLAKMQAAQAGRTGMKSGGKVSASKRADGCCVKGKTKGRMV
jgi:hypothetical protein